MARLLQLFIRLYQRTLSPDHGWLRGRYPYGYCRYYPSCSQYAYDAVGRYGAIKGSILAGARVLRCNPWAKSRVDQIRNYNS
jgi:putative membrane protein insertion efficiency factor